VTVDAEPLLGCIVQIDKTPTDYDERDKSTGPVPADAQTKKLHSEEERVYGMDSWLQFR